MGSKEDIDKIFYSYATSINGLEEENKLLRETVDSLKSELDKLKQKPFLVCTVKDVHDDGSAIIKLPNGNEFMVAVSSECNKLSPGEGVLAEQKNLTVIKKIDSRKKFDVEKFIIVEKPTVKWGDIGGLKEQERQIKEVIELPLKKPELFKKVGIVPPKGILLHGPPGTGKTMLAKAVAASTNSTFIEVVGSELVQKFIGEGAKLVKEIFALAREKAPSIVFIDEIDSLAATRVDVGTSGEREVQRTFMQLLAEIDGFKALDNVKIIGCTNRKDILDPAITRPGRLDRLIRIDNPDSDARKEIFKIHSTRMNIDKKVSEGEIAEMMKEFSGAEIKSVCTEAGYFAIRSRRYKVGLPDLVNAIEKVKEDKDFESDEYKQVFG